MDKAEKGLQYGIRYHATMMKSVAEIATPFNEEDPAVNDLYLGSTFGADLMFGYRKDGFIPYMAVGVTDVSTFFLIGDDLVVSNNESPYAGAAISLGTQWRPTKKIQAAGEFYTAPGYIYTGRLRASYLF